jgi:hypothetical protein
MWLSNRKNVIRRTYSEAKNSLFQFLASDKLFKEVKNPYIEFISVNDALKLIDEKGSNSETI